jgi:hypothetical protein
VTPANRRDATLGAPRERDGPGRSQTLGSRGRNLGSAPGDVIPLSRDRPPWSSWRRDAAAAGPSRTLSGGRRCGKPTVGLPRDLGARAGAADPVARHRCRAPTRFLVVNRPSVVPLEESTPGVGLATAAFVLPLARGTRSALVVSHHLDGLLLPRDRSARAKLPTLGFAAFPTGEDRPRDAFRPSRALIPCRSAPAHVAVVRLGRRSIRCSVTGASGPPAALPPRRHPAAASLA